MLSKTRNPSYFSVVKRFLYEKKREKIIHFYLHIYVNMSINCSTDSVFKYKKNRLRNNYGQRCCESSLWQITILFIREQCPV